MSHQTENWHSDLEKIDALRGPENWPPLQKGLEYMCIFCTVILTVKNSNLHVFLSSLSSVSSLCGPLLGLLLCFFCSICQSPFTARWQWWIFCVHGKHTKGSDKGKINNKANILTERQKEPGRKDTQWIEQYIHGFNSAWRCFWNAFFFFLGSTNESCV